ncbi:TPA: hypothetical protein DIU27_05600 [Candidatus Collierbacteria bacterium]|nr:MAG: hypothetical protein UW56_C0012G0020 [Candidatus Collierbacteria bacterium GW2011_GWD1_44_27]KKT88041.1 MAG: hypothetical protein UW88_C0016G0006 [Candidatus Collierbacteria bacterium GW2011_GWD2_45_10]HCQ31817.1 hypothetical protein [Candidatus Collierbacteria bacterium]
MSKPTKKILGNILLLLGASVALRFGLLRLISEDLPVYVRVLSSIAILIFGAVFVLTRSAELIEETTEVLSEKTKLAGGLLQSFGTAFPDMVLGVSAAFISLSLRNTDYERAINFAIIAAATTFGSNIYNIGHAAWCVYRQNLANSTGEVTFMFPHIKSGGHLTPMKDHRKKPLLAEFNTANLVLVSLTILTTFVAISMVLFGKISSPPLNISEDLYQLSTPVGWVLLALCLLTLFRFRKTERPGTDTEIVNSEENQFRHNAGSLIWLALIGSGISIFFAAESMVRGIEVVSDVSGTPFVIAGILAGVIGCLGEIIVVHNFSVNPRGRIGDAIVGVAMDNIVTITGASIVAIMGGIFLGGSSLIMIFVLILCLNTVLIWQISDLKNFFLNAH